MNNHYYNSEEFNDEHPRPGFRAHPRPIGSGRNDYPKVVKSPSKAGRKPFKSYKQNRGHQVTLEDLFGKFYFPT